MRPKVCRKAGVRPSSASAAPAAAAAAKARERRLRCGRWDDKRSSLKHVLLREPNRNKAPLPSRQRGARVRFRAAPVALAPFGVKREIALPLSP